MSASPDLPDLPALSLRTRVLFAGLAQVPIIFVAAGVLMADTLRLPAPCALCVLQRFIYLLFGFWALCGVFAPGARRLWCVLLMLTAAGGMAAAGWQSWMEYAPHLVTECGFGEPALYEQFVNWLGAQWPALFMVMGFCTQQEWSFLGLSLANWSFVFFLGLFLAAAALFAWTGKVRAASY